MSSPDIEQFITVFAIYMVLLFGPMFLAEYVFRKPGRELAWNGCYIVSGAVFASIWIYFLFRSNPNLTPTTAYIVMTVWFGLVGLGWMSVHIYMLIQEILNRGKVRAETLF